ncbi:MAG: PorP/SprF family type IX secretion system membrane protein [Bacteroidales bacterium]|nr:PorP/SprF family type IX secretion system membrane protein [Bacteroidales bacterium]MBN2757191.1 PorP/SprF family type IX secretion system membrane protein [Bacteroidales bacterium]
MTNLKKILANIVLILFFLVTKNALKAQDVQFSQLFADKMYLNPAFAGSEYCPNLMLSHRNQWPTIQFPFLTYSVAYDQYSELMHGGIGFRLMKDDQGGGVFSKLNADLIYSNKINLSPNMSLKLALEASVYQQNTNSSGLIFSDMIDPLLGVVYPNSEVINNQAIFTPDFSSALLFSYKNYSIGFIASHIPQSLVAEHNDILPLKFTSHISAAIPIFQGDLKKTTFILEPNIVYIQQLNATQLYYGMYFDINNIAIGMFYRQNLKFHFDALIASFHFSIKQLKIGYSYDVTLSSFYKQTLGSHEISFTYLFNCDKKIKNYKTISCPSF